MTVKELIELNGFIGDITLEIRGKGAWIRENDETYSYLHQDWHIGVETGVKPKYPSKKGMYIPDSINKRDDGEEYYDLILGRVPAELLKLHVVYWRVCKSYRIGNMQHNLEHIIITAWTDETKSEAEQQEQLKQLERARKRVEKKREGEEEKNTEGQLSMENIFR